MYYVNHEQIDERLDLIPVLTEASAQLCEEWREDRPDLLLAFAQERLLHLAVELVTDVGSLLIDGFIMRDASSYEDIIDILQGEGVFPETLYERLQALVRLRKPLVQEYARLERNRLDPLTKALPDILPEFGESVKQFIVKELG